MAEESSGRRAPPGLDHATLLEETERLLAHVTSGTAKEGAAPKLPEGTVESVLAMRAEMAAGAIRPETELKFFAARTALGQAAWPATVDSLACYASGEAPRLYRELRLAGLIIFILLVLSFLGFTLLSQSLRTVELLNDEIDKLSQEAPAYREAGNCDRLVGVNYQVNLRKEKILLAYNAAQVSSVSLTLPTLVIRDWRRQISVELYSEQLLREVSDGRASCREPQARMAGGIDDSEGNGENDAHLRRLRCWRLQHAESSGSGPNAESNIDCGMQEVEQAGRAVQWTYGSLVLPMLFATYGGLVAARRRALWRLRNRTLTADRTRGYWMRVGIGAFFGGFLSHVLPTFVGDPLVAKLPPFAVAFLAGYKIEALLDMLDRFRNPEAARDKAEKAA